MTTEKSKPGLDVRDLSLRFTKLNSVEMTFPSPKVHRVTGDETRLVLAIEQSQEDWHNGEGMQIREPPRLSIRPSHGWGGFTREECMWIAETIPALWDEWERKVGSR